jgi:SAM-dependent methyltransferase
MRRGWEQAAARYREGLGLHLGEIGKKVSSMVLPLPPGPVLDLACGPGTVLEAVSRVQGRYVNVGCDFSFRMVRFARHSVEKSQGVVADQDALPFSSGSFGVVVSSMGTIFSRDPEKQLQEIARLLKTGGKFGFSAWGKPEETALGEVSRTVLRTWPHPYEGHVPPLESPYSAGRSAWLEEVTASAGLVVRSVQPDRIVFRFPDVETAARALVGTGRFSLVLEGKEELEEELLDRTRQAFLPHRDPRTGQVQLENRYYLFVLEKQSS